MTFGLGWGYSPAGLSSSPTITIAGTTKIGNRIALVTDNWLISSKNTDYSVKLLSAGVKTIGRKTSFGIGVLVLGTNSGYSYSNTNYFPTIYLGVNVKLK